MFTCLKRLKINIIRNSTERSATPPIYLSIHSELTSKNIFADFVFQR